MNHSIQISVRHACLLAALVTPLAAQSTGPGLVNYLPACPGEVDGMTSADATIGYCTDPSPMSGHDSTSFAQVLPVQPTGVNTSAQRLVSAGASISIPDPVCPWQGVAYLQCETEWSLVATTNSFCFTAGSEELHVLAINGGLEPCDPGELCPGPLACATTDQAVDNPWLTVELPFSLAQRAILTQALMTLARDGGGHPDTGATVGFWQLWYDANGDCEITPSTDTMIHSEFLAAFTGDTNVAITPPPINMMIGRYVLRFGYLRDTHAQLGGVACRTDDTAVLRIEDAYNLKLNVRH